MQAVGLQERYHNDEDLAVSVRMIPALAFVPLDKVVEAFETLQDSLPAELEGVINYFEDTYIGHLLRRRRATPMYHTQIWNVHSRVVNDLPRTNNGVEGWNRKMQSAITSHHPNIWRFLRILQREQSLTNAQLNQLFGGHAPQPPKKKYKDCSVRISHIVADFNNRSIKDYLKAIALNISV